VLTNPAGKCKEVMVRIVDPAGSEPLKQEPISRNPPLTGDRARSTSVDLQPPADIDSVEVSSVTSKTIESMATSVSRLSELREQVRDGSYQVSPNKISQKVVNSMLDG
jgi:anti-sigma28 factor (negative regulator of flagellin synthesis)